MWPLISVYIFTTHPVVVDKQTGSKIGKFVQILDESKVRNQDTWKFSMNIKYRLLFAESVHGTSSKVWSAYTTMQSDKSFWISAVDYHKNSASQDSILKA